MTSSVHGIFCRFEGYALVAAARKSGGNTLSKVASEAMRSDGFCDHVPYPRLPTVIFGESPLDLLKPLMDRQSTMVSQYWHAHSNCFRTRKQRVDRPLAAAGVLSVPSDWNEYEPRWQQFIQACVEWLKELFGESRLRSIVEHRDETCLHLHVFLVPHCGEDICSVHPGFSALRALDTGASLRERRAAYRSAMTALLDCFHERVGSRFGLVRKHINAKRMTRKQWHIWKWYRDQEQRQQVVDVECVPEANSAQSDRGTTRVVDGFIVHQPPSGLDFPVVPSVPGEAPLLGAQVRPGELGVPTTAVASAISAGGCFVAAKKVKSDGLTVFAQEDFEPC